jgi:hypothetical protein
MSSDFYCENTHKAKKQHKCKLCGEKIEKQINYIKVAGLFDGDFFSFKAHKLCNDFRNQIYNKNDGEEIPLSFNDFSESEVILGYQINNSLAKKLWPNYFDHYSVDLD